jgi:hypothetical protein
MSLGSFGFGGGEENLLDADQGCRLVLGLEVSLSTLLDGTCQTLNLELKRGCPRPL